MIDIKQAVAIAQEYFVSFFSDKDLGEILLEAFELSEDGKTWKITLISEWHPSSGTASIGPGDRLCKIFEIDSESGQVRAMRKETV